MFVYKSDDRLSKSITDVPLTTVRPSILPYSLLVVYSVLCQFIDCTAVVGEGGWDVDCGSFVTFSRHCLERYRWIHETIVCTDDGHTNYFADDRLAYYVILCLRSTDQCRWLDGLDWALTHALILLVETYSDIGQSCDQRTWLTHFFSHVLTY